MVVIPAYCSEKTLGSCLGALRQSGEEMEVVIVHDTADPQGLAVQENGWQVRELRSPREQSAGAARNHGAAELKKGILVFLDADVVVEPEAVRKLVAPIRDGRAEATVGNYSFDVRGLSFAQKYKQLYIATVYSRRKGYLKNEYWTALGAIRADIFAQVGGFDARYRGAAGEDTELGQRISRAGHRILAVPDAAATHLHSYTLGGLLRNDLCKGTQSMLNGLRNRSISDHRHSSRIDMLAVASACLAPLGVVILALVSTPAAPAMVFGLGFVLAWAGFRHDLIRGWSRGGLTFLLGCLPLAYVLDVVRGLAVISGFTQYLLERRKVH